MAHDRNHRTRPRIVTLDIVRGIAVMGIFSVNIVAFAMLEAAYFNPAGLWRRRRRRPRPWVANFVLIDGKMRSLFSFLFGASMLLVIERAEAAGKSRATVHFRRMLVLLASASLHFYLHLVRRHLVLYALVGMVAFLFRRKSAGR